MAKNTPAFQFYPSDFLGGVMMMSDAAVGVYIKLLAAMWIAGGRLPNCQANAKQLASRSVGTSGQANAQDWLAVFAKFEVVTEDGIEYLVHRRLVKIKELQSKRAVSGSLGGQAKGKQKSSKPLKSEDRRMKSEDSKKPIEVSEQHWDDWLTVRKSKRAGPITATALKLVQSEAVKAKMTLDEAIAIAAGRGWVSFKADWLHESTANGKPREVMTFAQQRELNMSRAAEKMKSDKMAKLFPGLTDER